jgi:non-ribosomal peptide synthase protein (TIGR01720 family)
MSWAASATSRPQIGQIDPQRVPGSRPAGGQPGQLAVPTADVEYPVPLPNRRSLEQEPVESAVHGVVAIVMGRTGRENLFDDVDLTRTVGWFTALYPVAFPVNPARSPAGILAEVETTLDQVPDHGLGYGLLRYTCSDAAVRERLAAVPHPGVSFNYLGRLGWLLGEHSRDEPRLFRPVPAREGYDRAPDNRRPYQWEFSAWLAGGIISIHLRHAGDPHRAERMMDRVCATLRAFITDLEPSRRYQT